MQSEPEEQGPLRGMRILIVEDEILIALNLEDILCTAGAIVAGLCGSIPAATTVAEKDALSAAVLDVRLGRETTEHVAELLAGRGIPFLFYSGQHLSDHLRAKFPDAPFLIKPVEPHTFVDAVAKLARRSDPVVVASARRRDQ